MIDKFFLLFVSFFNRYFYGQILDDLMRAPVQKVKKALQYLIWNGGI